MNYQNLKVRYERVFASSLKSKWSLMRYYKCGRFFRWVDDFLFEDTIRSSDPIMEINHNTHTVGTFEFDKKLLHAGKHFAEAFPESCCKLATAEFVIANFAEIYVINPSASDQEIVNMAVTILDTDETIAGVTRDEAILLLLHNPDIELFHYEDL